MFEWTKLCNLYESMSAAERGLVLTEKSVKILSGIKNIDVDGLDPINTLAAFIIGSTVSDGKIDEREYLLIYPALVKVFGYDFDFYAIKNSFSKVPYKKLLKNYTKDLISIISRMDEDLGQDIIILCLCIVSLDGKVNLKEKRYVKQLLRA